MQQVKVGLGIYPFLNIDNCAELVYEDKNNNTMTSMNYEFPQGLSYHTENSSVLENLLEFKTFLEEKIAFYEKEYSSVNIKFPMNIKGIEESIMKRGAQLALVNYILKSYEKKQ